MKNFMNSETKNTIQKHSSTNAQENKQNSNSLIEYIKQGKYSAVIRNNGLESTKNCKIVIGHYAITDYLTAAEAIDLWNCPDCDTAFSISLLATTAGMKNSEE